MFYFDDLLHMYTQLSHVYSRNGQADGVRSVARQFEEGNITSLLLL